MIEISTSMDPIGLANRLCDLLLGSEARCHPDPAVGDSVWMVGSGNNTWLKKIASGTYRLHFRTPVSEPRLRALVVLINWRIGGAVARIL